MKINYDTTIEDLLFEIPEIFSKLDGCITLLTNILYFEDVTLEENLDDMISNYNFIAKMLT